MNCHNTNHCQKLCCSISLILPLCPLVSQLTSAHNIQKPNPENHSIIENSLLLYGLCQNSLNNWKGSQRLQHALDLRSTFQLNIAQQQLHASIHNKCTPHNYCTHQKVCASTCLNNISTNMCVPRMSQLQCLADISNFLISVQSNFCLLQGDFQFKVKKHFP